MAEESPRLILHGLAGNNLERVRLEVRIGGLNLITGVAGAGKTSLLEAAVAELRAAGHRVVTVDSDPIGRTPRSNPATYTGAFDLLRDLYASTPEATALGLGKGNFSFNTAGGRCEACEGAGVIETGMRYLGRVDLVCEACRGRRFHADVLSVELDGLSIADVLAGTVQEAADRFRAGPPKLSRILQAMMDLGLGYLPLGQNATRCPEGRLNGSSSRPNWRGSRNPASSSWMNQRRVCMRRTWRRCGPHSTGCARQATPCS